MRAMSEDRNEVLSREVYVGDGYKPFGDLTAQDAGSLADRLSGHTGGGLEKHTTPVAIAWSDLAKILDERGAGSVRDLDEDQVRHFATRLRIVPPGGSWL
jgi:hypothetical protein